MTPPHSYLYDILSHYAAGYFPLYDTDDRFYWERLPLRAYLPINDDSLARARRMKSRILRKFSFDLRYTSALSQILHHLKDPAEGGAGIKEHTWVRAEVVHIYNLLHDAGLLRTIEAWHNDKLAGALLGIVFPGTFIAETMYSLLPNASKFCLCHLIEECHRLHVPFIDVQTPHDYSTFPLLDLEPPEIAHAFPPPAPHPCVRLGERVLPIQQFMALFLHAWRNAFPGTTAQFLTAAQALSSHQPPPPSLSPELLTHTRQILQLAASAPSN